MNDFLLEILDYNEGVDYSLIISIVVGYLLAVWFVVCTWVFADSRQRYESFVTSLFFTIVVFLLGPPFLMIYILIRPEHTLEEDYYMNLALSGERELKPIQFDGDKGFDFNLNISVEPKKTKDAKHEMNMNIAWVPQSGAKEKKGRYKEVEKIKDREPKEKKNKEVQKSSFSEKSVKILKNTGNFMAQVFHKLSSGLKALSRDIKEKIDSFEDKKQEKEEKAQETEKNVSKKKNNKKEKKQNKSSLKKQKPKKAKKDKNNNKKQKIKKSKKKADKS